MAATHDADIIVNVYGEAQPVKRKSFGLINLATDQVGAGFPLPDAGRRLYASETDVAADADLLADAKAELAGFFNQPVRPEKVAVVKVGMATLAADLDKARAYRDDWFGLCTTSRGKADQLILASWGLTNKKLTGLQSSDAEILAGTVGNLFEAQQAVGNGYGLGLYHGTNAEPAIMAWLTRGLSVDPDQKATVWYHKPLIGISGDDITPTQYDEILDDGGNAYVPFQGVDATGPGKLTNGDFVDVLISREWWKARTQESIAQLQLDMSHRGEKIPYTNLGLGLIAGRINAVGQRGVNAGHFVEGSIKVVVPDISTIDPADIVARQCTISAEAVLTGGVKKVTLNTGILAVAA